MALQIVGHRGAGHHAPENTLKSFETAIRLGCDVIEFDVQYAADGTLAYTDDTAPWFDMGLISRFGKERADALKVANRSSHPAIYAR